MAEKDVYKRQQQAGAFVMRHKKGFLIAGVLFLIACMLTVSYTHLDVYKRQGMSGKPITSKPVYGYLMDEDENFIIDAVSYTHLKILLRYYEPR